MAKIDQVIKQIAIKDGQIAALREDGRAIYVWEYSTKTNFKDGKWIKLPQPYEEYPDTEETIDNSNLKAEPDWSMGG